MRALAPATPKEGPLATAIRTTLEALQIKTTDYPPATDQIIVVGLPDEDVDTAALAHTLHDERNGWALILARPSDVVTIVSAPGDPEKKPCLLCALNTLEEGAPAREGPEQGNGALEEQANAGAEGYLTILAARTQGTSIAIREGHEAGKCTGPWIIESNRACPVCGDPEIARRRIEGLTLRTSDIEMEADRPGQHPPSLGRQCRGWLERQNARGPLALAWTQSTENAAPDQWTVRALTHGPETGMEVPCTAQAPTEPEAHTRALEMVLDIRAGSRRRWMDAMLDIEPQARDLLSDKATTWSEIERAAAIASGVSYADALAEAIARCMAKTAADEGQNKARNAPSRELGGGPAPLGEQRERLTQQIALATKRGARAIVARDQSFDDIPLRTVEVNLR